MANKKTTQEHFDNIGRLLKLDSYPSEDVISLIELYMKLEGLVDTEYPYSDYKYSISELEQLLVEIAVLEDNGLL